MSIADSVPDTDPDIPYTVSFVVGKLTATRLSSTYSVPLPIALRSPYLRNFIYTPPRGLNSLRVELPYVEPHPFSLYLSWLEHDSLNFSDSPDPYIRELHSDKAGKSLSWRQCYPLFSAYVLGARFQHSAFCDHIISLLSHYLAPDPDIDIEIRQYIFSRQESIPKLKCFIFDRIFAKEINSCEVLQLLAQRLLEGKYGDLNLGAGCEYHLHDQGEACLQRLDQDANEEPISPRSRTHNRSSTAISIPPRIEVDIPSPPDFQEFVLRTRTRSSTSSPSEAGASAPTNNGSCIPTSDADIPSGLRAGSHPPVPDAEIDLAPKLPIMMRDHPLRRQRRCLNKALPPPPREASPRIGASIPPANHDISTAISFSPPFDRNDARREQLPEDRFGESAEVDESTIRNERGFPLAQANPSPSQQRSRSKKIVRRCTVKRKPLPNTIPPQPSNPNLHLDTNRDAEIFHRIKHFTSRIPDGSDVNGEICTVERRPVSGTPAVLGGWTAQRVRMRHGARLVGSESMTGRLGRSRRNGLGVIVEEVLMGDVEVVF